MRANTDCNNNNTGTVEHSNHPSGCDSSTAPARVNDAKRACNEGPGAGLGPCGMGRGSEHEHGIVAGVAGEVELAENGE